MADRTVWIGATVGVAGLAFGVWQYLEHGLIERGRYQAVVDAMTAQVERLEVAIDQQQQLNGDIRVRLADLERHARYLHGEQRETNVTIHEVQP